MKQKRNQGTEQTEEGKTKCVGGRKLTLVKDRLFPEAQTGIRPEDKRRQMRNGRMGCKADTV